MLWISITSTLYIICNFHKKPGTSTYSPHIYVCVWGWRTGRRRQLVASTMAVDTLCWRTRSQHTGHLCAAWRQPAKRRGVEWPRQLLWQRGTERQGAPTFQSHGFHLGRLTLIPLQLPLRNRRWFPQVEKGTPAAHGRFFHFILRPPPKREKVVCIKISKGLSLFRGNEQMMERTQQPREGTAGTVPVYHTATSCVQTCSTHISSVMYVAHIHRVMYVAHIPLCHACSTQPLCHVCSTCPLCHVCSMHIALSCT